MAKILFVSGSYFPYATANAVCTKKFEDVLKSHGHKVIYCNRKHDIYEPDYHIYEGTELYTVGKNSDLFFQTIDKLSCLSLPNNMRSCFEISNRFFRLLMKLGNIGKSKNDLRESASDLYINQYGERIADIVERESIEVIVSVSMPFDSHKAVLKAMQILGRKNIQRPKWMAYCIDAYWSKAGIDKQNIPKMKDEELEVFKSCDIILFLDTISKDYDSCNFDQYRMKMHSLPLPLFDIKQNPIYNEGINCEPKCLNFVYTGTIYDDFSNVDSLAYILQKLSIRSIFHFMGKIYPKSMTTLERLKGECSNKIYIHGRQSYDYAKGSMQHADILINLANDNANQIPSKIFEYMACRKPILNIYRNADDVGTLYLQKYPLAFNFNVNDMEIMLDRFQEWLESISCLKISYEELHDIYKDILSDKVVKDFYNLIKPYLSVSI